MAEFKTVCRVGDLKEGEGRAVSVGDKVIALFRCADGIHAIDDTCPHVRARVVDGVDAVGTAEEGDHLIAYAHRPALALLQVAHPAHGLELGHPSLLAD